MELNAEDLKTIAVATRHERFWRYWRFVEVLIGLGMIGLGFWLTYNPEIAADVLATKTGSALAVLGGVILGGVIRRWTDSQRQLLIRLASSVSPRNN